MRFFDKNNQFTSFYIKTIFHYYKYEKMKIKLKNYNFIIQSNEK